MRAAAGSGRPKASLRCRSAPGRALACLKGRLARTFLRAFKGGARRADQARRTPPWRSDFPAAAPAGRQGRNVPNCRLPAGRAERPPLQGGCRPGHGGLPPQEAASWPPAAPWGPLGGPPSGGAGTPASGHFPPGRAGLGPDRRLLYLFFFRAGPRARGRACGRSPGHACGGGHSSTWGHHQGGPRAACLALPGILPAPTWGPPQGRPDFRRAGNWRPSQVGAVWPQLSGMASGPYLAQMPSREHRGWPSRPADLPRSEL